MVKEVLFPDRFIVQAFRLIKIRWLAVLFAVIIVSLVLLFNVQGPNYKGISLSILILLLINFYFYYDINKLRKVCKDKCEKPVKVNINLQIIFDFIILTLILHFSGGIENPCIVFFIFHMIISGIYLSPKNAFFIAGLAVFLFLTLVLTEYFGLINHYSINNYITEMIINEPVYFFSSLALFVLTSFISVYIAVSLSEQLRITKDLLKQSNQSLLDKDKIKDEFIQRITHDIKGGLAVTQSCLSVVDKQILGAVNEANADFITKALNRTNKMISFVSELLALTKMRLENRYDTKIVSVNEIINAVLINIKSEAEKKKINVSSNIAAQQLYISGIKVSIEESIMNLLSNAIKYTPENGKVNISAFADSNKIVIKVSDTGYGIPEEDLPNIFDDFYRSKNITGVEGSGLGLSLVKAIVARHNGSISVISKVNVGSTFTMEFNIAQP